MSDENLQTGAEQDADNLAMSGESSLGDSHNDDSENLDEHTAAVKRAESRAEELAHADELIASEDLQEGELNSNQVPDHYGASDLKVL